MGDKEPRLIAITPEQRAQVEAILGRDFGEMLTEMVEGMTKLQRNDRTARTFVTYLLHRVGGSVTMTCEEVNRIADEYEIYQRYDSGQDEAMTVYLKVRA